MTVNRERGAVVHHVQAGSACRPTAQKTGAPLSRSARTGRPAISPGGNVLEASSKDSHCGAATVTQAGSGRFLLPAFSHLVQPPAHSGAGGPVRNSEAGRGEPEALESVLAAVGGAK